jgi:flagellar biosynthesis protein FlhG
VPRDSQLANAVMQQMPVSLQSPSAKSSLAFETIAARMMNRELNQNVEKRGMAAFFSHIVNGKKYIG